MMKSADKKKEIILYIFFLLISFFVVFAFYINTSGLDHMDVIRPYVVGIMLVALCFIGINKDISYRYKIILSLFLCLVMNVFAVDVFSKITTEVRVLDYDPNSGAVELLEGEEKNFKCVNHFCEFDVVEVFFDGNDLNDISISISDLNTGHLIYEVNENGTDHIIEDNNKKAILINPGEVVSEGEYNILIKNNGTDSLVIHTCGEDSNTLNVVLLKHTNIGVYMCLIIIAILVVYIGVVSLIVRSNSEKWLESFFLSTIIAFGVCNLILMPAWSVPDTWSHFAATYRFSSIILGFSNNHYWYGRIEDGEFFKNIWGKDANPSMFEYAKQVYNFKLICSDNTIVEMPFKDVKMEYYSIINYWPQVIGMVIGRAMNLSSIVSIYLSRIFIFVFYVWGCWNALKNTPIGKGAFALIPLLPMSIMLSSAISYDTMVLIVTLNFVACVFSLYYNPDSLKMLVQTCIWSFMLGGTKGGGYLILLPLVLILCKRAEIKKSVARCSSIIGSGLFSAVLFDKILQIGNELFQFGEDGNGKMKASFALIHPFKYICMVIITYIEKADYYIFNMMGTQLAWLEPTIPTYVIAILAILLLLYSFLEIDKVSFVNKDKIIMISILALSVFTTPAMLLSWTDEGSSVIGGIQGRYYLPVLVITFMIFTKFVPGYKEIVKIDGEKLEKGRFKCVRIFEIFLCLAMYYMIRLYLRR